MEPGNESLWYLLVITERQWRKEPFGVLTPAGGYISSRDSGIDMATVISIAEKLHIPTDRSFFIKLHLFEGEVLRLKALRESDRCSGGGIKEEECRDIFGEFFEWTCKTCKDRRINGGP